MLSLTDLNVESFAFSRESKYLDSLKLSESMAELDRLMITSRLDSNCDVCKSSTNCCASSSVNPRLSRSIKPDGSPPVTRTNAAIATTMSLHQKPPTCSSAFCSSEFICDSISEAFTDSLCLSSESDTLSDKEFDKLSESKRCSEREMLVE